MISILIKDLEIDGIVAKIDNYIDEKGVYYISKNINKTINDFGLKSYFLYEADEIQKRNVINKFLTQSKYPKIMEIVIINYLNALELTSKEELNELFIGQEKLLSDNIKREVCVDSYYDRKINKSIKDIKSTSVLLLIFIMIEVFIVLLRPTFNIDNILIPLLTGFAFGSIGSIIEISFNVNSLIKLLENKKKII